MNKARNATPPVLLLTIVTFGQATVAPETRSKTDRRPAPAAKRMQPVLDVWWQDAVFYELFVRSFADSKAGPLANDGVGDFRGLIERLDYLNDGDPKTTDDLGITALWLMPITESPSYHGYDTTDYRTIDREYGTNADFLEFVNACRKRGIRVTIDLVLNHCSNRHPWFQAAANGDPSKRNWFIWHEDHPGWRGPWNQSVWHRSPGSASGFYYGLFWHGMPDFDYEHEPVTSAMFDVISYWLTDMRIDGFRLDAIRHLIEDGQIQENTPATHAWLKRFFNHTKSVKADAMSVGEVWASSEDVSRYVGDQMDVAFEFSLSDALLDAIRKQDARRFTDTMTNVQKLYPLGMYATFLRNHDQPRVLHVLNGDREAAMLAAAIQFALPGVPYIYYGEEIGMTADKPDPQIRTPLPWTGGEHGGFSTTTPWIDLKPDYKTVNIAAQTDDPTSMLNHYRRLVRARLSHKALRTGAYVPLKTSDPRVLAFMRQHKDESILCLFNLSKATIADIQLAIGDEKDSQRELSSDLLSRMTGNSLLRPVNSLKPRASHLFVIESGGG